MKAALGLSPGPAGAGGAGVRAVAVARVRAARARARAGAAWAGASAGGVGTVPKEAAYSVETTAFVGSGAYMPRTLAGAGPACACMRGDSGAGELRRARHVV